MYLIKSIKKIIKKKPILFTTPGHSQGCGLLPEIKNLLGKKAFEVDFSEILGLDNLQNPTDSILKSQIQAGMIYGSQYSHYLVNGSSSGILALMLSSVNQGEKILIAKNAHKSVINALVLSGAIPVWINTEWLDEWNIPAQLDPEKVKICLDNNHDIKVVWLTSPTYHGITTDVAKIAKLCRDRKIILIIDEAHGALWNFSERLPSPAIHLGADASVQSLHKNASSLTQGAILHLNKNSKINPEKLQQCLNIVNTTSPSYLILASIEAAIVYLNSKAGRKKLDILLDNIDKFYEKLSKYKNIYFMQNFKEHDKTKILLGINKISGYDLSNILENKFNIEIELDNNKGILAQTGIGTDWNKLDKLANSIIKSEKLLAGLNTQNNNATPLILPETVFTPQEAFYKKSEKVDIKSSIGLISKNTIVTYPPGIPVLIAGEKITKKHLVFLKNYDYIEVIRD